MDTNQNASQNEDNKSSQGPLIVIVEDDKFLSNMYTAKFSLEGLNVLTATDGEEGLRIILEKKPKLILLDMMLPKITGQEVLTRLRKDPWGKDANVIALTNLAKKEEAKKALELGAKEYLVKAMYTPEEVVEKIKSHLS